MTEVPPDVLHRLKRHGQEHVLSGWDTLTLEQRQHLVEQLAGVDLAELESLFARRGEPHTALPPLEAIEPMPVVERDSLPAEVASIGEEALRKGEIAVLLVAGGQGSRLGADKPKGIFPVGPISGASLFEFHAKKVLALRNRYKAAIPFVIMTSPATDADTRTYFQAHDYFGLPEQDICFFIQGMMPALDGMTGKLLLERPGQLFLSPNGHGGSLMALADSGLLADLQKRGIKQIFYFQVDNPLVRVADPYFIGHHVQGKAEVSSKVIYKDHPAEKVGILALLNGRKGIIEYSDLPKELAEQRDPSGHLRFRAGSPAIHLFSVEFLDRITRGVDRLNYHIAHKKVPYFDPFSGETVQPARENALKFELFVFDALPLAQRWSALQVARNEEFAPLKNATGADSPETVRRALIECAARWLEGAGIAVPRNDRGESLFPLEIAAQFALDEQEFARKVDTSCTIQGPTILQ